MVDHGCAVFWVHPAAMPFFVCVCVCVNIHHSLELNKNLISCVCVCVCPLLLCLGPLVRVRVWGFCGHAMHPAVMPSLCAGLAPLARLARSCASRSLLVQFVVVGWHFAEGSRLAASRLRLCLYSPRPLVCVCVCVV